MAVARRILIRPDQARDIAAGALLLTLALSVGFVIGNPGVTGLPVVVIALAAIAGALLLSQAYTGFLVMVACSFTLAVVAVTPDRYLNAFDLLLPFMFPAALFGALRREAQVQDRVETGEAHARIRVATDQFAKVMAVYFAIAIVSLVPMVFRVGAAPAMNSAFLLTRAIEGAMLFPLGLWWLRSGRRIEQLYGAACLGGVLLAVVSLFQRVVLQNPRPGMTWILNQPTWPTEDPNQAGLTMVLLMALVFAHHAMRPRRWNYLLMIVALVVLVLSLSRSGFLAMGTFLALNFGRVRVRYILSGVVLIGLALLLAPQDFWTRMFRTITLERGSLELYSFLIRVYGYVANLRAFLDNWLFGTGYLSGPYVSHNYNELKITGLPADNYYLETAVGMGVIGLGALVFCFVRLFQLGRVVRAVTPPGTLGHQLARFHGPLIVAVMIANLTGDNLVGMVAIAQLALWCSLMVRAGHQAVGESRWAPPGSALGG
jgi:hypothetical protein